MQPQSEVTADITPEPGDFYSPFDWTRGNIYRWTLVVLAAILGFDAWKFRPSQDSVFMLCVIVALALIFIWPWLRIRYQFWQYPAFRKPRRFTFDSEGMHFQSEDARGDYKWSAFSRVHETPRRFLFMQTKRSGTTIPKRSLSQSDIRLLRKLVQENFRGKGWLRID